MFFPEDNLGKCLNNYDINKYIFMNRPRIIEKK